MNARSDEERMNPSPWVTAEHVGGEGILHDQRAGQVHVLNGSAARVWELCEGRPTLAELTASLAESYGLPVDHVRTDVAEIVEDFRAKGLLVDAAVAPGNSSGG